MKIIHGMYIFDIRRHADGSIKKKFKVRLVARGCTLDMDKLGDNNVIAKTSANGDVKYYH